MPCSLGRRVYPAVSPRSRFDNDLPFAGSPPGGAGPIRLGDGSPRRIGPPAGAPP